MAETAMAESLLEGVAHRVENIKFLIDPSRSAQDRPAFLLDVTEALQSCALLRDYLRESCKLLFHSVFENQIEDYNLSGQLYLMAVSFAQKAYAAVRRRVEEVRAEAVHRDMPPHFGEMITDFEKAVADVEALGSEFKSRWPWVDLEKFHGSIADEQRGVRRRSVKEIHDGLRDRVRRMG